MWRAVPNMELGFPWCQGRGMEKFEPKATCMIDTWSSQPCLW
jgi:hypothetical protein